MAMNTAGSYHRQENPAALEDDSEVEDEDYVPGQDEEEDYGNDDDVEEEAGEKLLPRLSYRKRKAVDDAFDTLFGRFGGVGGATHTTTTTPVDDGLCNDVIMHCDAKRKKKKAKKKAKSKKKRVENKKLKILSEMFGYEEAKKLLSTSRRTVQSDEFLVKQMKENKKRKLNNDEIFTTTTTTTEVKKFAGQEIKIQRKVKVGADGLSAVTGASATTSASTAVVKTTKTELAATADNNASARSGTFTSTAAAIMSSPRNSNIAIPQSQAQPQPPPTEQQPPAPQPQQHQQPASVKVAVGGGLDNILNQMKGPSKISTVTKTGADWETFKDESGVELKSELEKQALGNKAYLVKKDFLNRVDVRRFEQEKAQRNLQRSARGK